MSLVEEKIKELQSLQAKIDLICSLKNTSLKNAISEYSDEKLSAEDKEFIGRTLETFFDKYIKQLEDSIKPGIVQSKSSPTLEVLPSHTKRELPTFNIIRKSSPFIPTIGDDINFNQILNSKIAVQLNGISFEGKFTHFDSKAGVFISEAGEKLIILKSTIKLK